MIKLINIVHDIINEALVPGTDVNLLKVSNNNYGNIFTNEPYVKKYGAEAYKKLQAQLKNKEISVDDFNDALYIANGLVDYNDIPKPLYHGSPFELEQSDLDPFIRSKPQYKQAGQESGTSQNKSHIGISLGPMKTALDYFQRGKYKEAWLYEFTFKSDIRCLYVENNFYGSSVYQLTKNSYDRLRKKDIDMITRGSEYLLIDTDKIASFKPVKKWTLPPGEKVGDIIDLKEGIHDPVKPGILKKRLGKLSCSRVRSAKSKLKDKGTHYAKALQRYLNYHC